jgi:hypothetical protein
MIKSKSYNLKSNTTTLRIDRLEVEEFDELKKLE